MDATQCAACREPIDDGNWALIPLGPGKSTEARFRARIGRPYNAVAAVVHTDCADPEREVRAMAPQLFHSLETALGVLRDIRDQAETLDAARAMAAAHLQHALGATEAP